MTADEMLETLRAEREEKKMPLREIARRVYTSRECVGRHFRGLSSPTLDTFVLEAKCLGYEVVLIKVAEGVDIDGAV